MGLFQIVFGKFIEDLEEVRFMAVQSKRFSLNRADLVAWLKQTAWFLAPFILALMPVIIDKVPKDWAYGTVLLWVLNRLWDILRRWYSGSPIK